MKKKIETITIILLSILLAITVSTELHIYLSYNLKPKDYEYMQVYEPFIKINISKSEARIIVDDLYDIPHLYNEKDLSNGDLGRTLILFRIVDIDKDLDVLNYVITYAHELTHLKYWCNNETFVSFKTFVHLYESDNKILKYIATIYANNIFNGSAKNTEYDCGYYIQEYLKEFHNDQIMSRM